MKAIWVFLLLAGVCLPTAVAQVVQTASGRVEGVSAPSGIHVFKGIPFAAPPVGDLRWQPPQPVPQWEGVRKADTFGARCMQKPIFGDMMSLAEDMSEDCLYLNVWTPEPSDGAGLPVLVYFYGGGFVAGDGAEPRYAGESMAQKGIVAVTLNYRLGVFGFLAHPELTAASPHDASGNYGLLDQVAALRWVKENIAAFGGDPARVTIAGESAGSISVSAQMVTPLARGLFAGAIGESGSVLGALPPIPRAQAEQAGEAFARSAGAASLEVLRTMPADQLLDAASKPGLPWFSPTLDGYFFAKTPLETFAAGEQAHVPLLVGWNSEEMTYLYLMQQHEPTPENFAKVVGDLYGDRATDVLKLYRGTTKDEVIQAATDLAGDRFIAYSTWKWYDLHRQTGAARVYRYYYAHPRPPMKPELGNAAAGLAGGVVKDDDPSAFRMPPPRGAVHSAEIEYAMGNLDTNPVYAWTDDDYAVSKTMQAYFANFVKTGDPNGPGLPKWPAAGSGKDDHSMFMQLDVDSRAVPDRYRDRYRFLDELPK